MRINEMEGVSINDQFIKWGIPYEELSKELELKHDSPNQNPDLKFFKGSKSINFSDTIGNQVYNFDLGFNDKNEFIELSSQIGFKLKIDDWHINYNDPVKELIKIGNQKGINIKRDGNGNFFCEKTGVIFSESSFNNNEFSKGLLEYIYLTKPKRAVR